MTHTSDCACFTAVSLPDGVDHEDLPPMSFNIIHCDLHRTAPRLLAACYKALDGMYDQFPQYETMSSKEMRHPHLDCYAVEVILDIRAAIAKAEGEQ